MSIYVFCVCQYIFCVCAKRFVQFSQDYHTIVDIQSIISIVYKYGSIFFSSFLVPQQESLGIPKSIILRFCVSYFESNISALEQWKLTRRKKSSVWISKSGHDLLAGRLLGHLLQQLLWQLLPPVVWRKVLASVGRVVKAAALRVTVSI